MAPRALLVAGLLLLCLLPPARALAAPAPAAPPPAAPASSAPHASFAAGQPYPWAPRIARAERFASRRSGRIGFAVIDERGVFRGGLRARQGFRSASVVKSVMLICYLNHPTVRGRALTKRDRALLGPMIRRSADEPANQIYGRFGPRCLERAASRAGIAGFRTQSVWGLSRVTPVGVARMFRRVDRIVPVRHRPYARQLLATVVPSQRWGLPPVTPPGWTIRFKGGFVGSPNGRIVNQGALFELGERRFSIAVLTDSPTHEYGAATLQGIGGRLLRDYEDFAG